MLLIDNREEASCVTVAGSGEAQLRRTRGRWSCPVRVCPVGGM